MNGYFVFAMALKHALIQCINRKSQSTSYTILLAFAEISRFFFLETKNKIRKSDEKSAGSMREFREKGAGMLDEHSHPPFRPELFQRKWLLPYTCA